MNTKRTNTRFDFGTKYADALRELAASEGRRNGMLLGVATLGFLAGRNADDIEGDLLAAGQAGRSQLTVAEVRRAVDKAARSGRGDYTPAGRAFLPRRVPHAMRRDTPAAQSQKPRFIEYMIQKGEAEWMRWRNERIQAGLREWETAEEDLRPLAALLAFSPAPLDADTLPQRMTGLHIASLFQNETEHLYAGPLEGARNPANVYTAGDFVRGVYSGRITPPDRVLANPITGEPGPTRDGGTTYRADSTVTAFRNAVVEFDELDKPGEFCRRQALFWLGVVTSHDEMGRMPLPVRCLVFSGSKSIHAVLRMDCPNGDQWKADWERLADALPGLDSAFRTPSQCMRLAGAIRPDGMNPDGTKGATVQTLLWCVPITTRKDYARKFGETK